MSILSETVFENDPMYFLAQQLNSSPNGRRQWYRSLVSLAKNTCNRVTNFNAVTVALSDLLQHCIKFSANTTKPYSRKGHAHYPDSASHWWRGPSRSEDALPLWSAVMSIISVCVIIVILQFWTGLWGGDYNYSVSFNMCTTTQRILFFSLASRFMSR